MVCKTCGNEIEPMIPYLKLNGMYFCCNCATMYTLDDIRLELGIDYVMDEPIILTNDNVNVDGEKISPLCNVVFTTGYFAQVKNSPISDDYTNVSIALSPPSDYHGLEYKKIAPTPHILSDWKKFHDEKKYVNDYYAEVLSKVTPEEVVQGLRVLTGGQYNIRLLCYEGKGKFCHRYIVADWLKKAGAIVCSE